MPVPDAGRYLACLFVLARDTSKNPKKMSVENVLWIAI